ncbi:MAG: hypothetical protein CSA22_08620 [Deltaproteobacteria bacterium]|nr:MAG: hypothetical protein CSA22_08620 [Deltaproteobacteria bacterium]
MHINAYKCISLKGLSGEHNADRPMIPFSGNAFMEADMFRLTVLVSGLLFALCGNAFGDLATDRAALVDLYDATHGDQ